MKTVLDIFYILTVLFLIINLGFAIPGSEIGGTKPKDTLKKVRLMEFNAKTYSYMYVYVYVCAYVHACVFIIRKRYTSHIYTYMYICVHICMSLVQCSLYILIYFYILY